MTNPAAQAVARSTITDGVTEVRVAGWRDFTGFINGTFLELPHYIWRGHRRSDWHLEPTLTRILRRREHASKAQRQHLNNFRLAIRGRRGPNPRELDENDAWALGQHNFLASPLLDWTSSPYAALFFAFAEPDDQAKTDERVVFGLNELRISEDNASIAATRPQPTKDRITFFRPLSDEDARLVNQAGMFTITEGPLEIEEWVRSHFTGVSDKVILARVLIPNADREGCLKALSKMNITYVTLFPDLYGASKHCNLKLEINNY